jgi:hypothetical protein
MGDVRMSNESIMHDDDMTRDEWPEALTLFFCCDPAGIPWTEFA